MKLQKYFIQNCLILSLLLCSGLLADVKSINGVIDFDRNSDGASEMRLNATGLGIATTQPSANLHVMGNARVSGTVSVGSGSAGSSNLHISGTIQHGIQSGSSNLTLGAQSVVMVDTSSDNVVVTLPDAEDVLGRWYNIVKTNTSNSIQVQGGGYIDEQYEVSLGAGSFGSLELFSSGFRQWSILSSTGNVETLNAVASDNLVGWWKLDEAFGSGTAVDDGLDADGVNNAITAGEPGVHSAAYTFDGSTTMVTNTVINTGNDTNHATFCAWVRSGETTDLDGIFVSRSNGIQGLTLQSGGYGAQLSYFWDGAATEYNLISGLNILPTNTWYFVAAVIEPSQTTLYVGEVEDNLESYLHVEANTARSLNGTWYIGWEPATATRRWDGQIDDVRLYNKSLSLSEITKIFNEGTTGYFPTLQSVTAADAGDQAGLGNGDTLTFVFSAETNQPLAGTKAEIDGLVNFGGNTLGADYTGVWNADGDTLVITVVDATGNTQVIGDTITMIADGTENLSDPKEKMYGDTSSVELTGSFGVDAPSIVSIVASDPDNADAAEDTLSDGDILTITFDVATSQPDAGTKSEIDGLINFGGNVFGADYVGTWTTPSTLVLTVTDSTGNTLTVGDTLTLIADGTEDLMNAGEIRSASTDSAVITGDFGAIGGANLIARWRLDEVAGSTTAYDNVSATYASSTNTTEGEAGRIGSAYEFDGTSSRVVASVSNHTEVLTNQATFLAWVKSDNPTDLDGILVSRSNGIQGLTLDDNNPNAELTYFWDGVSTEWQVASGLEIDPGNWYFVAAVISASNTVLYAGDAGGNLNNFVHAEANGLNTLNGEWRIGEEPATGIRLWDGHIDDVRIYNKSLSSTEIQTIYNRGL